MSAPSKIPVEWLDQVRVKVNIHCGELPKYAGMMPIFWQINDGLDEISIILHDLTKEIDAGKVFLQTKIKLSHSLFETSKLAKSQSAHLLKKFLMNVESNIENAKEKRLSSEEVVFRKFPTKKEIKDFKKKHRLI